MYCYLNFLQTDDMLGPWIELGFHECVGGCDGCVNLHLDPNKGKSCCLQRGDISYNTSFFFVLGTVMIYNLTCDTTPLHTAILVRVANSCIYKNIYYTSLQLLSREIRMSNSIK